MLRIKIKDEEASLVARKLDEEEIVAAYRRARELYDSRELPELRQLINLYLDQVIVYPEYVEIHINSIPGSHIPPDAGDTPAVGGLHIYRYGTPYFAKINAKHTNDIAAKAFAAGRFLVPEEVQNSFGQKKNSQGSVSKTLAVAGGGGESRTPVRKPVHPTFYERSRCSKIPFPRLPAAGSAFR